MTASMAEANTPVGVESGRLAKFTLQGQTECADGGKAFLALRSQLGVSNPGGGLVVVRRMWSTLASLYVEWDVVIGVPCGISAEDWKATGMQLMSWLRAGSVACAEVAGATQEEEVLVRWEREVRMQAGSKAGSFEEVRNAVAGDGYSSRAIIPKVMDYM
jgi:hypothetical protein